MSRPRASWDEGWRWDVRRHLEPTSATISVSSETAEQQAERERKIKRGARVVPFGFARVLQPARPDEPEPDVWEGMGL